MSGFLQSPMVLYVSLGLGILIVAALFAVLHTYVHRCIDQIARLAGWTRKEQN